jgi:hypothetical protein
MRNAYLFYLLDQSLQSSYVRASAIDLIMNGESTRCGKTRNGVAIRPTWGGAEGRHDQQHGRQDRDHAAKEVWLGAGGSYIQINGGGIINGAPGRMCGDGQLSVPKEPSDDFLPYILRVLGSVEFINSPDATAEGKNP